MYSCEDFERLFICYKIEACPHTDMKKDLKPQTIATTENLCPQPSA